MKTLRDDLYTRLAVEYINCLLRAQSLADEVNSRAARSLERTNVFSDDVILFSKKLDEVNLRIMSLREQMDLNCFGVFAGY